MPRVPVEELPDEAVSWKVRRARERRRRYWRHIETDNPWEKMKVPYLPHHTPLVVVVEPATAACCRACRNGTWRGSFTTRLCLHEL